MPVPAGHQAFDRRALAWQGGQYVGGVNHLLEVVDEQERAQGAQAFGHALPGRVRAAVADTGRLRDAGQDQPAVVHGRQVDEEDPVREVGFGLPGDFQGGAGLPDAPEPGYGDQPHIRPAQPAAYAPDVVVAARQWRRRDREPARLRLLALFVSRSTAARGRPAPGGALAKRPLAGGRERQHRAETEDVARRADHASLRLFRGHEPGRAHDRAGLSQHTRLHGPGDAEIDHPRPVVRQHHVRRLQVTVHHQTQPVNAEPIDSAVAAFSRYLDAVKVGLAQQSPGKPLEGVGPRNRQSVTLFHA